ncbi:MAG TPA: hypothetical protein VGU71_17495 [Candidatus Dormibacteraeota bacterium]|nr:hypothetical protein [Candidatus Dormibacteraeota bacterium]
MNQISVAKRVLFGLVISVLAHAVIVLPVLAAGPVREKLDIPTTGTFDVCYASMVQRLLWLPEASRRQTAR